LSKVTWEKNKTNHQTLDIGFSDLSLLYTVTGAYRFRENRPFDGRSSFLRKQQAKWQSADIWFVAQKSKKHALRVSYDS